MPSKTETLYSTRSASGERSARVILNVERDNLGKTRRYMSVVGVNESGNPETVYHAVELYGDAMRAAQQFVMQTASCGYIPALTNNNAEVK